MGRVVMVTGVSRYLGGRFTQLLQADPDISRVIGVDVVPPKHDLGDAEFVRADIRNPVIGKVISRAEVDTVVHMAVLATPLDAGGRATMKEINVIGTMQLLAACQKAPSVRKLVVKSSTAVYGSSPQDPAMFTEDLEPNAMARTGLRQGLRRGRGLRARVRPPPPGRRGDHPAVRQLRRPEGAHAADVVLLAAGRARPCSASTRGCSSCTSATASRCCWRTTLGDHGGTFNIAGDGVMTLSQAIRRAGRPSLPLPAAGGSLDRAGAAPARAWPTSPPSRCGSCPTAGSSTPAG